MPVLGLGTTALIAAIAANFCVGDLPVEIPDEVPSQSEIDARHGRPHGELSAKPAALSTQHLPTECGLINPSAKRLVPDATKDGQNDEGNIRDVRSLDNYALVK